MEIENKYLRDLEAKVNFRRSKCECAGLCSASENHEDRMTSCHFFSWEKANETCELGHMDLGWHFNYTHNSEHQKHMSVNAGEHIMPFEGNITPKLV